MMTLDWEKAEETVNFSEMIEFCVTKLGIYSQLNKYMKIYECQWSRSFTDLCPRSISFQQFQTSSIQIFGLIEAKFHVEPPWNGGTKFSSNGPGHLTMPLYGKNL